MKSYYITILPLDTCLEVEGVDETDDINAPPMPPPPLGVFGLNFGGINLDGVLVPDPPTLVASKGLRRPKTGAGVWSKEEE